MGTYKMNFVLCSDIVEDKNIRGRGGVGTHIHELSKALVKIGNNVTVIAQSHSSVPWSIEIVAGFTMTGIPSSALGGIGTLSSSFVLSKELRAFVSKNSVDAIQFSNLTGLMTYLRGNNLKIPVWTKCHGFRGSYISNLDSNGNIKKISFIKDCTVSKFVSELCYKLSPHIVANSRSTKMDLIQGCGIRSSKISVIHNGINHELFQPKTNNETLRNKLGLQGKKIVLFVGDFSFLKGVFHLILSFKRVKKEMSDAYLLIIGGYKSGSDIRLMDLIKQTNLCKDVKIAGFVPYSELPNYYSMVDLCIVPSLSEPFGNVALEGMASGKPVVVSKVGGLAEIVREKELLVPPGDVAYLASTIIKLLRNDDLRIDMGNKALECSKEFSWVKTAKETMKMVKLSNE
jgi:glycosyltransferase involved in cell wall biosynthesis